eukprot:COSAG02_NODE_846_length_16565_cov_20.404627_13_plen_115_part_00
MNLQFRRPSRGSEWLIGLVGAASDAIQNKAGRRRTIFKKSLASYVFYVTMRVGACRVSTDGSGIAWLKSKRFKIWVRDIGFINLHDPFGAALLCLPLDMRKAWGRQIHWKQAPQ